jgi:hypothetical protein
MSPAAAKVEAAQIAQAHALYCELTGQTLGLGFDRERLWYELLRTGVTLPQVGQLLRYLQREIREGRRNVGALKLSNFLQPDRFEEDWAISRVALRPATAQTPPAPTGPADPREQERGRQRALELLRQFKTSLR